MFFNDLFTNLAHRDQFKKLSSGIKGLGTAFATENAPCE